MSVMCTRWWQCRGIDRSWWMKREIIRTQSLRLKLNNNLKVFSSSSSYYHLLSVNELFFFTCFKSNPSLVKFGCVHNIRKISYCILRVNVSSLTYIVQTYTAKLVIDWIELFDKKIFTVMMLIVYLFVKLMNIISMMLNNVQFLYLPVYTTVTKESSIY